MNTKPLHLATFALVFGPGWSLAACQSVGTSGPVVAAADPFQRQVSVKVPARDQTDPFVLAAIDESSASLNVVFAQLRVAEAKLAAAQAAAQKMKAQVDVGAAPSSELQPLQVRVEEAKLLLQKAKRDLLLGQRYAALAKPIQIEVKNARLQQAADLLSRVSTMNIRVDKAVPSDITVSTVSGGAPLGSVLESIAYAANVTITTSDDGGLTLSVPARMTVNGKTVVTRGGAWPWGDDLYATIETTSVPVGQRWKLLKQTDSNVMGVVTYTTTKPQTATLLGLRPVVGQAVNYRAINPDLLSQATVTAVGSNTVVVTEAGMGPKGENGLWLSLYAVKNGQLIFKSQVFHRAKDNYDRTRLGLTKPKATNTVRTYIKVQKKK